MRRRPIVTVAFLCAVAGVAQAQTDPNAPPGGAPPVVAPPVVAPPVVAPAPATTPAAATGDAQSFGAVGQLVITGEASATFEHESVSMDQGTSTAFTFEPSLDYFVMPNLSIGGGLSFSSESFSPGGGGMSTDVTVFALVARVGYDIPLTPMVSIWPLLQIGYGHSSSSSGGQSVSGYAVPFAIFAPILFHPASHFFLGIGPAFDTELVAKEESQSAPKTTDFGVRTVVGGYFGGM